jgi:hypothetical protein
MNNCEICGQELINGEFEEKLGICVNCIMVDSRKDSFKSLLIVFLIFLGTLMSRVGFLSVLYIVRSLINTFGFQFLYLIPSLIIYLIIGPGLICFIVFYKYR